MTELKPCPFCGSHDLREDIRRLDFANDIFIECRSCGAKIQMCEEYGHDKLVEAWNRRVTDERDSN